MVVYDGTVLQTSISHKPGIAAKGKSEFEINQIDQMNKRDQQEPMAES
jgi:hypothetical protein